MSKRRTKKNGCGANILAASSSRPTTENNNAMTATIVLHLTTHSGATTSIDAKIGKSLMQVATAANIDGIAADCGGSMTCATCHVYIDEPFLALVPPPDADELAMLAFTAVPRQPNSRLSCQITLAEALDGITVSLPASQY